MRSTDTRAIRFSRRVLNYDLERWVTELRPQLQSKQHSLLLEVDDAPLPAVMCDREQLRQVVAKLVTSAHTSTGKGGRITLTARADAECVRVEVRGTGIAIAPTAQSRAFEPFVQRIVEAHGGSMMVPGEAGRGTAFAFTIPLHSRRRTEIDYSAA